MECSTDLTVICCCDDDPCQSGTLRQRIRVLETLCGVSLHDDVSASSRLIQKRWKLLKLRRHLAVEQAFRKVVAEIVKKKDSITRTHSATRIQAVWRGFHVRSTPTARLFKKYFAQMKALQIFQSLSKLRFRQSSPSISEDSSEEESSVVTSNESAFNKRPTASRQKHCPIRPFNQRNAKSNRSARH